MSLQASFTLILITSVCSITSGKMMALAASHGFICQLLVRITPVQGYTFHVQYGSVPLQMMQRVHYGRFRTVQVPVTKRVVSVLTASFIYRGSKTLLHKVACPHKHRRTPFNLLMRGTAYQKVQRINVKHVRYACRVAPKLFKCCRTVTRKGE